MKTELILKILRELPNGLVALWIVTVVLAFLAAVWTARVLRLNGKEGDAIEQTAAPQSGERNSQAFTAGAGSPIIQAQFEPNSVAKGAGVAVGPNSKVEIHNHSDLPDDSLWAKMGLSGAPDLGSLYEKYPWGYLTFFAEEIGPSQFRTGSPIPSEFEVHVDPGSAAQFSPQQITLRLNQVIDKKFNARVYDFQFVMSRMPGSLMNNSVNGVVIVAEVIKLTPRGVGGVIGFRPFHPSEFGMVSPDLDVLVRRYVNANAFDRAKLEESVTGIERYAEGIRMSERTPKK